MNKFNNLSIYKKIINEKLTCFFVSPHFDDAIFSAGGLMHELAKKGVPIILVNVFTKASPPPYTLSIKKFLKDCGYEDAHKLYEARINEDADVAYVINAKVINLGFVDGLWRKRKGNGYLKILSKFVPEFGYEYPIFRLARWMVSKESIRIEKQLSEKIEYYIKKYKNAVIFGPLGIGNHPDHHIVKNALQTLKQDCIIYWADYPYFETDNKLINKSSKFIQYTFEANQKEKMKLVLGYKSQISAIFGKNKINTKKEIFFKYNEK